MIVTVNDQLDSIDFAPSTVLKEIIQNVRTIISTVKTSVPLDRGFGIDGAIVDLPIPVARARITTEILQAVGKYEPRAKVVSVDFESTELTDYMDGSLIPNVTILINDDYLQGGGVFA